MPKQPKRIVYYDFDETLKHFGKISEKMKNQLNKDKKEANTKVEILSCRLLPLKFKEFKKEAQREFGVKVNQIKSVSFNQCYNGKIEFLNNKKEKNPQAKIILYDDKKDQILKTQKLNKEIRIIDPRQIKEPKKKKSKEIIKTDKKNKKDTLNKFFYSSVDLFFYVID